MHRLLIDDSQFEDRCEILLSTGYGRKHYGVFPEPLRQSRLCRGQLEKRSGIPYGQDWRPPKSPAAVGWFLFFGRASASRHLQQQFRSTLRGLLKIKSTP